MNRPIYENKSTLELEQKISDLIFTTTGLILKKMPVNYRVDYCVLNGQTPVAFIEVKGRNYDTKKYPNEMISLSKWIAGCELETYSGLPFYVCAVFEDKTLWYRPSELIKRHTFNGRKDRNDWQDIEPCIYVPLYETQEEIPIKNRGSV